MICEGTVTFQNSNIVEIYFPRNSKKNHQKYPFISNELVLVLHPDTQLAITDISELATVDVTRFAIADPKLAPAGEYSKAVLENYNLWECLKQKLIII